MFELYKKRLAVFGIFGFTIFLVFIIFSNSEAEILGSHSNFSSLGVIIEPKSAEIISYESDFVNNVNHVVWATIENSGDRCYLGAFYKIAKATVAEFNSPTFINILRNMIDEKNHFFPVAKEFPEFFIVFEPNRKLCTGNFKFVNKQVEIRRALWESVFESRI
jgi:hypothetical protein